MDGLTGAASLIAVIEISAKITSLCFQYSVAVKYANRDIDRLQRKVSDLKNILEGAKRLLDGQLLSTAQTLVDSLKDCFLRLEELQTQLDPGKTRKAMSRLGVRAIKWPFTSKEIEKIVNGLERYEQTFILALQVDQTGLMFDFNQKMDAVDQKVDILTDKLHPKVDLAKLPIAKGAFFDSHVEEHNARCLGNTRVELQHGIAAWAKDQNGKPLFLLNGMAGTGKSTFARTVAQSFADSGQLGASFFFKKGEGDCGNAARFFTTIATDLMVHVPELIPGIMKAIDADPAISEKALKDQFEKLILQPLSEMKQTSRRPLKLVLVIDALDECDRKEDMQSILQLLSRTKDLTSVSLRIFLTSRPELPIRLGFKQMSDGTYQDFILHEVPKQTIEQDLALFLEHELVKIREQRSLSMSWPGKDQIEALVEIAVPLFIFAATACRYIGDERDNPKNRLDMLLKYQNAPQASMLDKTYLPILTQLFDDEDEADKERRTSEFREIVGAIIVLESPLSIVSLAHLLDILQEDISCRLDLLHSVLSIPVNDYMPIRLLHLSFRDFLLDPQKQGKSPFWVDEQKVHGRLTSKCLQLMSSPKGLRQNMCNLSNPGALKSEIETKTIDHYLQPEIRYACRYWVHHLEQSRKRICDNDPVSVFLQKHLLYWLEAMSLIKETSESIRMIDRLQLLTNSNNNVEILDFLRDAKRFALRNQSILEDAPLQLYSSALIFAPEISVVRRRFNDHIPRWTTRISKIEKDWNGALQTLEGHSYGVNFVVFSPDGQLVASASGDSTVRLWDATTGAFRSTLKGHSDQVNALVFSPDGQLIASASDDYTVRLWNIITGSCHHTLKGHLNRIKAVVFSPDGQLIASASDDYTLRLWDRATGLCCSTLEGHSNRVNVVSFSPDGQLVASGSDDYTVRLWNVATRSCCSTLEGHSNMVNDVAFSPDGQLVVFGSDDYTVRLWDVATGFCRKKLKGHSNRVKAVVFSPNGQLLASGSEDSTVRLWDASTGACRSILKGHLNRVKALKFSPDGQLIASWSKDSTVRLWDVATDSCFSTLKSHVIEVHVATFSPDGQQIASGSADSTIRLWDVATRSGCRSTLEGHLHKVNAVAFSPNGQLLASASGDSTVRLWDAVTGSCRNTLEGHFSGISAVAFSPDGQLVASASRDSTVRLWDAATGSCRNTLEGHLKGVNALTFSPDGQLIASGSDDSTVRLWDAATGSCRSTLHGHTDWICAVAFSPDSQLVASGSDDFTVRLWDAATGSCRRMLEGHSFRIRAVAFSSNGQLVASCSIDSTVRLWDVPTGSCRITLEAHSSNIHAVSFSSKGSHIITDRGLISLPSTLFDVSSCLKKDLDTTIFAKDQWIESAEKRLLWLPAEYRATCSAVWGNSICLGHGSGHITIFRFDFESMKEQ